MRFELFTVEVWDTRKTFSICSFTTRAGLIALFQVAYYKAVCDEIGAEVFDALHIRCCGIQFVKKFRRY